MDPNPFVNPGLVWAGLKARYGEQGRVQIIDFLAPPAAAEATALAKTQLPWVLHYRDAGQTKEISERDLLAMSFAERQAFLGRLDAFAREDFQFAYFGCSLTPDNLVQFEAGHPIRALAARLVTHEFVDLMAALIDDPAVRGLTASLTRYDPGQYLLPHDDTDGKDDRRAAFVLNLSEDWWPDWGGLLQFIDDERNVIASFTPHNNSMAVFKVPQFHAVSYVTPHALRSRYAITGWVIA